MSRPHVNMKDFTYDLPETKIAQYPLEERDASKLLVYRNGEITDDNYQNLYQYIPEQSLLIFNNSKVIPARLIFTTSTGAHVEIFCLEPASDSTEIASAMQQKGTVLWKCLVGRMSKWKEPTISLQTDNFNLFASVVEKTNNGFIIQFNWQPETLSFAGILEQFGAMPIPNYLKRKDEIIDSTRYQTVYAEQKGSVAAPTAGLHFTEHVFTQLKSRETQIEYITLHVGAGTFKPVKGETIEDHEMHAEWIEVVTVLINKIIQQITKPSNNTVIAVGTTSLRTIESLYWMGVKALANPNISIEEIPIKQWEVYALPQDIDAVVALQTLLQWLQKNNQDKIICKTQILILDSYQLKIVSALITNFHQPASTLLLLIAAVVGQEWKNIYRHAMEHNYRFLSYGDGSLLFKV